MAQPETMPAKSIRNSPHTAQVPYRCLTSQAPAGNSGRHAVIVESAVTLAFEGVGEFVLMCTPGELEALALGFAHTEGLIASAADVAGCRVAQSSPWSWRVEVRFRNPPPVEGERNLVISSSCGACGARLMENALSAQPVYSVLTLSLAQLLEIADKMSTGQPLFRQTGGCHCAVIFDAEGQIISAAEDIGRHNALDKAIGKCLIAGLDTRPCGTMISSRASYELISKAARAGLGLVATLSAPSSLAIATAERRQITLCAFVREKRLSVYTHSRRVKP